MIQSPSGEFSVITVMRDEWPLAGELCRSLRWCREWHLVVTDDRPASTADLLGRLPAERPERVLIHHVPLSLGDSFDAARGVALQSVTTSWVLVLDTDERVPIDVVNRLAALAQGASAETGGFWLPRRNHVFEWPLRAPASWPDWQLRLVRKDRVEFPSGIHQKYRIGGQALHAEASDDFALRHYSFRSNEQFLEKLQTYTTIEARTGHSAALPPSRAIWVALRFLAANLGKMRGLQDGEAGIHFAVCWAFYRYVSHTKAWEAERQGSATAGTDALK